MFKIAIIAPEDLVNIAVQVIGEIDENIDVYGASMSRGFEIAKKLEAEGYDVIIARGGTEIILKTSNLTTPIVGVPITPIDIHRTLKEVSITGMNICFVIFENMLAAVKQYEEITNTLYPKYIVKDEKEVKDTINEIGNGKVDVVIGGGIIVKFAREIGIRPLVIKTGKEAFLSAILEAKRLAKATRQEKERNEKLRAILTYSHNGIISINEKGYIDGFNMASERLLEMKRKDVIGRRINDVFEELGKDMLSPNEEKDTIKIINKKRFLFSKIPIEIKNKVVGNVAIFEDVTRIQEMEEKIRRETISTGHYAKYTFEDIVGDSEEIKEIIRIGKEYSVVDSTVLIEGETGTGKEIMAQSIHNNSSRAKYPFVAVNCAALPETLLESELFGYTPGAFTGADKHGKKGLFELAHKGTIFLDEISEMNPSLQGRLLRVLQERKVMRLGDNKVIPINVRVIAATNANLKELIKKGKFREDLYYRINVLNIKLIPLRERKEDIKSLLYRFVDEFCNRLGKKPLRIEEEVINCLMNYDWPGNVRELKNFSERLVVMSKKDTVSMDDIKHITENLNIEYEKVEEKAQEYSLMEAVEIDAIKNAIDISRGNMTKAATLLGISRTTLWRKIKKYNIVT